MLAIDVGVEQTNDVLKVAFLSGDESYMLVRNIVGIGTGRCAIRTHDGQLVWEVSGRGVVVGCSFRITKSRLRFWISGGQMCAWHHVKQEMIGAPLESLSLVSNV